MSLRGRYVIDRVKRAIGSTFRLPVPPYGDPGYWESAYRSFGPQDTFEWGDVTLNDLRQYEHKPLDWETGRPGNPVSTTLGNTLGIQPHSEEKEPILMLGCGNSRLGEEMIEEGWNGPMVQVDVASGVVDSMTQRCAPFIEQGNMKLIQDDATELSAFRNGMMSACFDKGLIDAVFCADEYSQCSSVLKSVHRVLRPGGVFVFLSFSRPEFLLPKLVDSDYRRNRALWGDVEVQELSRILLYRFQKANEEKKTQLRRKPTAPKGTRGRTSRRS